MKNLIALNATALLVAAGLTAAHAGNTTPTSDPRGFTAGDFDTNKDGTVDRDEFGTGFTEDPSFLVFDANGDGVIDRDEYNNSVYDQFDQNRDGVWDEDEQTAFDDSRAPRTGDEVSQ